MSKLKIDLHRGYTTEQRFHLSYEKVGDCWIWIAALERWGYGQLRVDDVLTLSHRYSYQIHKGRIPKGLFVLHTCDTPACVNPNHLFLGTHQDNMNDMKRKGRARTCDQPKGESSPVSKLTNAEVAEIRKRFIRYSYGKSNAKELSAEFGIHEVYLRKIVYGRARTSG